MAQIDLLRFLSLAAIWGSSYMFMRIAAPGFGPLPLVMLRLAGATLFFLPWLLRPPVRALLRGNLGGLLLLGAMNSAIPFTLLAFSTLRLQAGYHRDPRRHGAAVRRRNRRAVVAPAVEPVSE